MYSVYTIISECYLYWTEKDVSFKPKYILIKQYCNMTMFIFKTQNLPQILNDACYCHIFFQQFYKKKKKKYFWYRKLVKECDFSNMVNNSYVLCIVYQITQKIKRCLWNTYATPSPTCPTSIPRLVDLSHSILK